MQKLTRHEKAQVLRVLGILDSESANRRGYSSMADWNLEVRARESAAQFERRQVQAAEAAVEERYRKW